MSHTPHYVNGDNSLWWKCISLSSKLLHSVIHPPTHSPTHPTTCTHHTIIHHTTHIHTHTHTHIHTHTQSQSHYICPILMCIRLLHNINTSPGCKGQQVKLFSCIDQWKKCTDWCTFWSTSVRVADVSQWFWTYSNAWTYKSDDNSCKSTFDVKSVAE